MTDVKKNWVNIEDKNTYYHQQTGSKSQLENILSQSNKEESIIKFILGGWRNPAFYSIPQLSELVRQASKLSKTSYDEILRRFKLSHLRDVLSKLDISPFDYGKLKSNYTSEERKDIKDIIDFS